MSDEQEFDIDAGVADIAESMGFDKQDDDADIDSDSDDLDLDVPQDHELDEAKAPPASWAKEHHEDWTKVPKEAQEYIELREKQMLDGIEQYKQGYKWGEHLNKVIEPFRDVLKANNVDEATAITNLFSHHRALTEGSIDQRQSAFIALGESLGLIPKDGQTQTDPRTQELEQRLARIEQQEQSHVRQQQEQNYNQTVSEVDAFASDPANVYFDELADDIVLLLGTGIGLKDAYEKAVWANPITRAKEQAKTFEIMQQQRKEKAKQDALAARKSSSNNMRTASVKRTNSEPLGSWDDTMNETLQRIKNH